MSYFYFNISRCKNPDNMSAGNNIHTHICFLSRIFDMSIVAVCSSIRIYNMAGRKCMKT